MTKDGSKDRHHRMFLCTIASLHVIRDAAKISYTMKSNLTEEEAKKRLQVMSTRLAEEASKISGGDQDLLISITAAMTEAALLTVEIKTRKRSKKDTKNWWDAT